MYLLCFSVFPCDESCCYKSDISRYYVPITKGDSYKSWDFDFMLNRSGLLIIEMYVKLFGGFKMVCEIYYILLEGF